MATSDFRNTNKIKIEGALHPLHIHKGATFELDENDGPTAQLNGSLNAAGRIIDPDKQKDEAAKILAEVELEAKSAKKLAAANEAANKK